MLDRGKVTPVTGRRRTLVALVALVAIVGFGLRAWYGSWGLDKSRFYDERFSFDNVRAVLTEGSLEPANGYYPALSYLPQTALLALAENVFGVPVLVDGYRFTPAAYLVCRLVQALYGALSLVLVFLVGRRLFSSAAGGIAAILLAFSPFHIHASAYFKPDAPLVAAILAAFYWSLDAVERPSPGRYALAGVGVALALSAKLTGGLIAIPLVVGTLVAGWRDLRRLALLALAGGASLALFLAANPYWRWYLHWLGVLQREYARKAGGAEASHWAVPGKAVGFLLSPGVHGAVVGLLGVAGIAVLAWVVLRAGRSARSVGAARAPYAMLLAFVVVHVAAYAVVTPHFKGNNFLPIVPFTALLAGWLLAEAPRLLAARLGWPGPRSAAAAGGVVAVLFAAPLGASYVYDSLVPTTWDAAREFLTARIAGPGEPAEPGPLPVVYRERWQASRVPWEGERLAGHANAVVVEVERLAGAGAPALDRADGEVFLARSLDGADGAFYRGRLEAAARRSTRRFEPRLFRLRGPGLVAIAHPWPPADEETALELAPRGDGESGWSAPLPAASAGATVSLALWVPFAKLERSPGTVSIELDGTALEPRWVGRRGNGHLFATERLPLPGGALEAALLGVGRGGRGRPALVLYRWDPAPARGGG